MARTLTKEEIFELPKEERLSLMDRLWDSLTPEDVPIEDWQGRLLDERLEAHEHDPSAARPWEEVRGEIFPPKLSFPEGGVQRYRSPSLGLNRAIQ